MKKLISVALVLVIALTTLCVFVGCTDSNKDDVAQITGITAKVTSGTSFTVGSAFDSSKITVSATLDDDTVRAVKTTAAIKYDLSVLKLDSAGKFTEKSPEGGFKMKVTYSDWSTEVSIKVA